MPTLGFLKKKRAKEDKPDPSFSQPTSPVTPITPTSATTFESSSLTTIPTQSTVATSVGSLSYPTLRASQDTRASAGGGPQMNSSAVQAAPYGLQPTPSPAHAGTPQSLPSINNLINLPQNDGKEPRRDRGWRFSDLIRRAGHHATPSPQNQAQAQAQAQASEARVTKGKYSLGDFDLLRTLGTGSFGRVHLVQSKHNQRFYAIKVLKKVQVFKMKQVEHTNDERRMLGEVKHPFLITLWGTFQDPRNVYMVMDFVEGGELFSLLRKSGRFPNPVAKFYAAEVTLALEYLHSKNIIYRDLKPENLLLDRHGHLKITDFGFAKKVPDKTWTLCGTPDYLAPEVVSNKGYNKSVDWWSLGILIYEMLCGYTPFWDGGSPMKIYENILRGKVKYPAYVHPDAQNLLELLITPDLTKRLGNLYGGSQDVKKHSWFSEVTWDRLSRKDIDAPYTPPVKAGAGDASQFDRYPEETEKYGQSGGDEYGYLFPDF
ncbi:Pkinase-domain-containing protein [Hypoxylon sp. FL1284]|nr:Pkinase-domain-containing protein [Hypoxylon sp. FL1284]